MSNKIKILLVDDDQDFTIFTQKMLGEKNYEVDILNEGKNVFPTLEENQYDLLIMDVMMPYSDGITICEQMRNNNYDIPILLITALQSKNDKLKAFEVGADDYLVKPFDWDELFARVKALSRRKESNSNNSSVLSWGKLELDNLTKQCKYDRKKIKLTPTEFNILEVFLNNPNQVFSVDKIINQEWIFKEVPTSSTIRSHIKGLRKKLSKVGAYNNFIETVYGMGYRLILKEKLVKIDEEETLKLQEENTLENKFENFPKNNSKTIVKEIDYNEVPENAKANKQRELLENAMSMMWKKSQKSVFEKVNLLHKYHQNLDANLTKEEIILTAHSMIGFLGSIGLHKPSQICRNIENLLKNNSSSEALGREIYELSYTLNNLDNSHLNSEDKLNFKVNYLQKNVLIIDKKTPFIKDLCKLSFFWNLNITLINDIEEIKNYQNEFKFDAILIDPYNNTHQLTPKQILLSLKETYSSIPVVVITEKNDLEARLEATKFKVNGFIDKTILPGKAINMIYKCLNQSENNKILVVDDDTNFLRYFKSQIVDRNLEIITLNNPLKLWDFIETLAPELLILDVEMPYIDGIELCKIIRNDPRYYKLPIIFLTSNLNDETVDKIINVGGDDFIAKSKMKEELHYRITTHLKRSQRLKKTDLFKE